jgi:snRNA-activating protein complex subunit 3
MKGRKAGALKQTHLQCLNQADTQKRYFERKGLIYHGYGELPPAKPIGGTVEASLTVGRGEVVLSVLVYHPIKKRRDSRLLLLGSQLLTVLRDNIQCFRDFIVSDDYSEDPSQFDHHSLMTGVPPNRSKSAFFFINNTFYNDRRHPNSVDLSAPVTEWVGERDVARSARLDHYQTRDMLATRLDQLSLRLGYPYLFCHHIHCQHILIFTDLRMLHPTDSQGVADYPRVFPMQHGKRRLCFVCNRFSPLWVTLEDQLAPESPCLFCQDCFSKCHYSPDGRKMGSFKAYPYNPTMLV